MDSFDIKIEKANAIRRYRRLRKIKTLFRFMELFVFLIIISKFSTQLPINFKLSGEYFRRISLAILSPWFVFVLGNAIIIVLLFNSGNSRAQEDNNSDIRIDFYNGYVENCEKIQNFIPNDESEKQRKQSISEEKTEHVLFKESKIHRSQSENFKNGDCGCEDSGRKLRLSATERRWNSGNYGEKSPEFSYAKDDMSNEEFQQTVEEFIARRWRSVREEEFSPIVCLG